LSNIPRIFFLRALSWNYGRWLHIHTRRPLFLLLLLILALFPLSNHQPAFWDANQATILSSGATDPSWSPSVSCQAVVTSIEDVLGSQYNTATGGAIYGGAFLPGIPNRLSLHPPCSAGVPANMTFVEIRNVTMSGSVMTIENCAKNFDTTNGGGAYPNKWQSCDMTTNLFDPNGPKIPNVACSVCMGGIHVGIDRDWNASQMSPPMMGVPSVGQRLDVQGFLYWNPFWVNQGWHLFSGWEMHPLTAWRYSGQKVPDFYLAGRGILNLPSGATNATTAYLGSLNGFQGNISLFASVSAGGPRVSLSATTAHLNASGWGNMARFTVTANATGTALGVYVIRVAGVSGSLLREYRIFVTVPATDFTISAQPPILTVQQGDTGNSTLTLHSLDGFNGLVRMAVAGGNLVAGLTASLVTLANGGENVSSLTVKVPVNANPGPHSIKITGTSGSLVHSLAVPVNVTVPSGVKDFSLTAIPESLFLLPGIPGASNIKVASINGFASNVNLSLSILPSKNLGCSLQPSTVLLANSPQSTLSCAGAPGTYYATIIGSSGLLSHNLAITIIVGQPPALAADPPAVTAYAIVEARTTISQYNFPGPVELSLNLSSPESFACVLSDASLSGSSVVVLRCIGFAGNFVVTIYGSDGIESTSLNVAFKVVDFALSAPPTMSFRTGDTGRVTITASGINGFGGEVRLGSSVSPSGLSCTFTPSRINLGLSASSAMACTGVPGEYATNITGVFGPLAHSIVVNVEVMPPAPDFVVLALPSTLTSRPGATTSSNLTATSVNGFEGEVSLSSRPSPIGLTVTFSTANVSISPGHPDTAKVTITTNTDLATSTYTLFLSGRSGSLTHTINMTIIVESPPRGSAPTPSKPFILSVLDGEIAGLLGLVSLGLALLVFRHRKATSEQNRRGEKSPPSGKPSDTSANRSGQN